MTAGFQTQVYFQPAPAVPGDFCDSNPRASVDAGPFGLVAGAAGVTIGGFGWISAAQIDTDDAPSIVNSFGSGPIAGFVHRAQQGLITTFLADASMTIPQGFPVTLMSAGGFWVKNSGSGLAVPGQKAYANFSNGLVTFAATGSASTASLTTSSIAAGTAIAGTASISGNVLTVTAVSAGTIYPGAILTGPSGVASGTQVVAQLSGTSGGVGTYALSIPEQTVASGALAGTYGILTVGGGGPPSLGSVLSGSGVTVGTAVWQQLTNTTWVVSPSQTVTSTTITATTNVETKFIAMSSGLAGELVKISSWPLG